MPARFSLLMKSLHFHPLQRCALPRSQSTPSGAPSRRGCRGRCSRRGTRAQRPRICSGQACMRSQPQEQPVKAEAHMRTRVSSWRLLGRERLPRLMHPSPDERLGSVTVLSGNLFRTIISSCLIRRRLRATHSLPPLTYCCPQTIRSMMNNHRMP